MGMPGASRAWISISMVDDMIGLIRSPPDTGCGVDAYACLDDTVIQQWSGAVF
jgi:hypothetical protein